MGEHIEVVASTPDLMQIFPLSDKGIGKTDICRYPALLHDVYWSLRLVDVNINANLHR